MQFFCGGDKLLQRSDVPKSYWNMLDGTADFSGNWHSLDQYTKSNWSSPAGNQCMQRKGNWSGLSKDIYLHTGTYTMSEAVFADSNSSSGHINWYGNNSDNSKVIGYSGLNIVSLKDISNRWATIHFTFTVSQSDFYYVRFESEDDQVNIYWADLMLNEGAVPLNWNYSLNDIKSHLGK
ncbi:hypothetical protein [Lactobacillus helveticus]|uniref:hypothetical protein n=1 Tax=Lactobacillus helveticus TaxID=1587 RepID=UPI0013FDDA1E|nr:hypothetical protein [Lactobacillus helveticus]NHL94363.1 hypothetical protein [Lactobacillus helveticus]